MDTARLPQSAHVEWQQWCPRERGVLLFVLDGSQLLLIEKKRGLGAGKVNGPGGRIDPGESAIEAAVRETREEVGITPIDPREVGRLRFQFLDGYSLHCTVFIASAWTGSLQETVEAKPFWVTRDAVPFDRMWADDIHWFPAMLSGQSFEGWFVFDADRMLEKHLITAETP
ncbi:MAG: hypothetical protein OHK005_08470 [Candidatus Methylacidiphilales bacterium]